MNAMYWLLIPVVVLSLYGLFFLVQHRWTNQLIAELEIMVEDGETNGTYERSYIFDGRRDLDEARQHRREGRWGKAFAAARHGRNLLRNDWARGDFAARSKT